MESKNLLEKMMKVLTTESLYTTKKKVEKKALKKQRKTEKNDKIIDVNPNKK